MRLSRFGFAKQLIISFGFAGLVICTMLGVSIYGSVNAGRSRAELSASTELQQKVLQAKFGTADFNGWQTAYALDVALDTAKATDDDGPSRGPFLASAKQFQDELDAIKALDLTEADSAVIADSQKSFDQFMAYDKQIIELYRSGNSDDKVKADGLVLNEEIAVFQSISKDMDTLTQHAGAFVAKANADASDAAKRDRVILITLSVVAIVCSAALATVIIRSLTKSLTGASLKMQDASDGLTGVSAQLASSSEETSVQSQVVSATAEQLGANMAAVAAAVDEMQASVSEIATSAGEASSIAQTAVGTVDRTNARVEALGQASQEIGRVIEVITSIAEQTNLLALNATIEAARAGEAGKGFAVVANEVKELAKGTAEATEEIGRRVTAIQSETGETVDAIGEIAGVIARINEMQSTIAAAVEEQTSVTAEIAMNINQAASGAVDIASNISGVSIAAQETANGAASAQHFSDDIAHATRSVKAVIEGESGLSAAVVKSHWNGQQRTPKPRRFLREQDTVPTSSDYQSSPLERL